MADEEPTQDIELGLEDAKRALVSIRERLMAGDEVDQRELTMLARLVATQLESVRARLEETVGPIDPELMKEEMRKRMTPAEYDEWLKGENERIEFRQGVEREKTLRAQLGEPEA